MPEGDGEDHGVEQFVYADTWIDGSLWKGLLVRKHLLRYYSVDSQLFLVYPPELTELMMLINTTSVPENTFFFFF